MKHRFLMLLPALLLLLTLSGCACSHEWIPADCLNPQVCAKCEETGEPALGHDWMDATCTAPQTCTRCAVTQGEVLAHTYDDWTFERDQISLSYLKSHSCVFCCFTESTEIDREQYVESLLDGYWDLWSIDHDIGSTEEIYLDSFIDGSIYTEYSYAYHSGESYLTESDDMTTYFVFGEDRSCQITMGGLVGGAYHGTGIWDLSAYEDSGEDAFYYINVRMSKPRVENVIMILCANADGTYRLCFVTANSIMWFYQEQDEILDIICTDWVADQGYRIQLRPDRTASCDVDGTFDGTWSLGANPGDRNSVGFSISYNRNEEDKSFVGKIVLDGSEISEPTMYLDYSGSELVFHNTYSLPGSTLPVGNWTSNNIFLDGTRETIITDEYAITFQNDGTFIAQLGQERSGTWEYISYYERKGEFFDSETGDTEPYICDEWSYRLTFNGKSEPVDILIEKYREDNTQMHLTLKMKDSGNNEIRYYFYKD